VVQLMVYGLLLWRKYYDESITEYLYNSLIKKTLALRSKRHN